MKELGKHEEIQGSFERQPNPLSNPVCVICKPKFKAIRKKLTIRISFTEKEETCKTDNGDFFFCPTNPNKPAAENKI